jgi:hypothetical protein
MATGPLRAITEAGVVPALGTPTSTTDTILATDDLILHIENGATASSVTLQDGGVTAAGSTGVGVVVTLAANTKYLIAVNPNRVAPTTGLITVTYANTTTVTAEWFTR